MNSWGVREPAILNLHLFIMGLRIIDRMSSPDTGGRQNVDRENPPSSARRQNRETGIPGI